MRPLPDLILLPCTEVLHRHARAVPSSSRLHTAASVATLLHFLIRHRSACLLSAGVPSAAGGRGGAHAAACQALPRCGVAAGCRPVSSRRCVLSAQLCCSFKHLQRANTLRRLQQSVVHMYACEVWLSGTHSHESVRARQVVALHAG